MRTRNGWLVLWPCMIYNHCHTKVLASSNTSLDISMTATYPSWLSEFVVPTEAHIPMYIGPDYLSAISTFCGVQFLLWEFLTTQMENCQSFIRYGSIRMLISTNAFMLWLRWLFKVVYWTLSVLFTIKSKALQTSFRRSIERWTCYRAREHVEGCSVCTCVRLRLVWPWHFTSLERSGNTSRSSVLLRSLYHLCQVHI